MKAIIMEICGAEAIVLDTDGSFVRIRNRGFCVGQEITISPDLLIPVRTSRSNTRKIVRWAAIAACVCILLGPIFSFLIMNSQSYGYVSVDVNPSIEYHINRFDRVVNITAVNKDGEALLATIGKDNMEGEDIEVALSLTIKALSLEGYLESDKAGLIISSSSGTEKASITLHEKLVTFVREDENLKGITVDTTIVSKETIQEASKLGTTAGKLKLIQSLGDDVDVQSWLDKSVSEIYAAVQEHSSGLPADTTVTDPETLTEPVSEIDVSTEFVTDTDPGIEETQPDSYSTTEVPTEADPTPVTQPSEDPVTTTEPSTEPLDPDVTTEEPEEPSDCEETTIPPEPDKDEDYQSWWEWFWHWILGR